MTDKKEKLKRAFLSNENFITVLKQEHVLDVIDNYFTREEIQQGLLYEVLKSPIHNIKFVAREILESEIEKFEQNFNETILINTQPKKACVISTLLAAPLQSSSTLVEGVTHLYNLLVDDQKNHEAPFNSINEGLLQLTHQLDMFIYTHLNLLGQLRFIKLEDSISLKIYLEQLQIESQRLLTVKFKLSENWDIFTLKLEQLLKTLASIRAISSTILKEYRATITKTNFLLTKNDRCIEHYKQHVFQYLSQKAYKLQDINDAWNRIFMYCSNANITASELIPEECHLISPLIDDGLIDTLREIDQNSELARNMKDEKVKNLNILQNIKSLLAVLSILLLIVGCGLKTEPKSLTPDLEPSIPYKVAKPEDIKNKG